jgi:phage baseplate assembly protein gpV
MSDDKRLIRIGQVSSIDYDKNLVKVTYPDMDDAVTDDLPFFSFSDEYKMPEVGKDVLVVHLSTGSAGAVCMGRYWNEDNTPLKKGKDIWRKELATKYGKAYAQYDHEKKEYKFYLEGKADIEIKDKIVVECKDEITIKAKKITLITDQGTTEF